MHAFARGEWLLLVKASRADAQSNNTATFRRRRCEESGDELGRRAKRALQLTQWESSQVPGLHWESALVAPGNEETRAQLIDPSRRPPVPRTPIAREFVEHNPEDHVVLDGEAILKNLRNSRRGAAAGLSGLAITSGSFWIRKAIVWPCASSHVSSLLVKSPTKS